MYWYLLSLVVLLILLIVFKYWIKFRLLLFGRRIRVLILHESENENTDRKEIAQKNSVSTTTKNDKATGSNVQANNDKDGANNTQNKKEKGNLPYTLYYTGVKRNIHAEKEHGYFIWLPTNTDTTIFLFDKNGSILSQKTINPHEENECFLKIQNKKLEQ